MRGGLGGGPDGGGKGGGNSASAAFCLLLTNHEARLSFGFPDAVELLRFLSPPPFSSGASAGSCDLVVMWDLGDVGYVGDSGEGSGDWNRGDGNPSPGSSNLSVVDIEPSVVSAVPGRVMSSLGI